ncbi:MAG: DUF1116 domain-containing protein, partial [Pseudomonadota bacterium]|nr:DUF1116 domain-containing protein [Pseudomonadota bacterium]
PEVVERLKWIENSLSVVTRAALEIVREIDLKKLISQALHMGDECHNRNIASTALFIKQIVPPALQSGIEYDEVASAIKFMATNDLYFLNLSMAACKAMLDSGHNVQHSTMVTAMSRNGVNFGIRMSGTGNHWFSAPSRIADGLFFPGFTQKDAAPDLGDSAITETAGIGGFAMASSPAIVKFVGGSPMQALNYTKEMAKITLGRNSDFTLPALDFIGTPAGIDARKVLDTGIEPVINTGIAHKDAGIGQIGAGVTRAPISVFKDAILALAAAMEITNLP